MDRRRRELIAQPAWIIDGMKLGVLPARLQRADTVIYLIFRPSRASPAILALDHGRPVELQILYPDLGISEPVAAATAHYDLDREAIEAAAQSAFVAPDRVVTVDVRGAPPPEYGSTGCHRRDADLRSSMYVDVLFRDRPTRPRAARFDDAALLLKDRSSRHPVSCRTISTPSVLIEKTK